MLCAALLLAAAVEIPVGSPPMIGGALSGLVHDGSHFVLLQQGVRTTLADDGAPLASTSSDSAALASSSRGTMSISLSNGKAYANDAFLLGPADAAAAAWDGTHYAVVWRDGGHLTLQFLGDNGGVTPGIDIADDAGAFDVAAYEGNVLVAWSSPGGVFARLVGGTAVRLGDGTVTDAAAGKDGFLVATLASGTIVTRHVDPQGHPDATYSVAPATGGAHLARGRYAYILAWPDGNRLRGERLDPITGDAQGPFLVDVLDQPVGNVVVASTAATTLVAYASSGIFAKQVDDTSPGRALPAHLARQSAVHSDGYLTVWQQETASGSEIRVNDVAVANGMLEHVVFGHPGAAQIVYRDAGERWSLDWPGDSAPARFPFDILGPDQTIASNGSESLRVWNDNGAIVAQHLGSNDERIVVDGGAAQKGTPHVRWDGAAWVVSWPEVVDAATIAFASMPLGGVKRIVATAPQPLSLTDWSDAANAVYYIRNGRLFMQRVDAARRRAAGH